MNSLSISTLIPSVSVNKTHSLYLLFLVIASFFTRFHQISRSNTVVWDESHFGKFASYYIRRKFYHDVHPPLAKMLLGLAGVVAKYDGNFDFKSGETYPEGMDYGTIRAASAFFGSLVPLVAFKTGIEAGWSLETSLLLGVVVCFDNALTTISRFILLDAFLLFFTALSVWAMVGFWKARHNPFNVDWWLWLIWLGLCLGLVSSTKWVGLFTIALVGLFTIAQLWEMIGDVSMTFKRFSMHFGARVMCLIALPIAVYVFIFWIHFGILAYSGPGDAQMSSLFQAKLIGNDFYLNPPEVAFYSNVTLKNNGYNGALLHSHSHLYPAGSKQQQITAYHFKDSNNHWTLLKKDSVLPERQNSTQSIEFVKHGDIVVLMHKETKAKLHVNKVEAPITKKYYEVSGYGNETVGNSYDLWRVNTVGESEQQTTLKALTSQFQLVNVKTGCLLLSHNVVLPEWGYKQAEVACTKDRKDKSVNTLWNVENHYNTLLKPAPANFYKSSFWDDLIRVNIAMLYTNNVLIPDPDKEPERITSLPKEWPLMLRGLRMCGWGDNVIKYLLIGNPLVWWGVYAFRRKRGYMSLSPTDLEEFHFILFIAIGGWILHYVPFLTMARVTYLHHYFPAFYFSCISFCYIFELWKVRGNYIVSVCVAIIASFVYFSPVTFGMEGNAAENYAEIGWVRGWDVY